MPAPYTAAQIAVARESWIFWKGKGASDIQAACLLGNEDGESSFMPHVVGDRGEAHGPFQWHAARIMAMQHGCGIDVRSASHEEQLEAAFWEMSSPKSSYRKVWPNLMEADDIEAGVTVLVHVYEGSAQQARDILRRSNLAKYWLDYARKNWEAVS